MSDKRFGRLAVKHKIGRDKHGRFRWFCICDCGKERSVAAIDLIKGRTKSCGCLGLEIRTAKAKELEYPSDEGSRRDLFNQKRQQAISNGKEWNLTREQFNQLTSSNCFYCGAEPSQKHIYKKRGVYIFNGIDRSNNDLGYTTENSVSCCWICNRAKWNLPKDDFVIWLKRVAKRWSSESGE